MIASYAMLLVLITQKTDALGVIVAAGIVITLLQLFTANGGFKRETAVPELPAIPAGTKPSYQNGLERAHDQARQRGIVHAVEDMIEADAFAKFNVSPDRVRQLVCYLYNIDPRLFVEEQDHHERIEEPNLDLQATYQKAYSQKRQILRRVEDYSHYGIFTFIHNYHVNWVDPDKGRPESVVQRAMLDILFPLTDSNEIWEEYRNFEPTRQPEPIWQFARRRYLWAKDQWPNLSDRITTIWTLQDFGLLPKDVKVETTVAISEHRRKMLERAREMERLQQDGSD